MLEFIVTSARGLDEVLKKELVQLLASFECFDESSFTVQPGQVRFSGELKHGYHLCLHSRIANRVLLVLNTGKCVNANDLYDLAKNIDWTEHFSSQASFAITFLGTNRDINNTQFGAMKVKDAIVDTFTEKGFERPNVDRQLPDIQFQARLRRETANICLDLSGRSLHLRGYRQETGDAPLKEQLAAAILYRSTWVNNMHLPLLDPMCGSGTIAIEAAMMASCLAPNLYRERWGFSDWLQHKQSDFEEIRQAAFELIDTPKAPIYAFDISTKLIDAAKANASSAGVEEYIEFKQCDAMHATVPHKQGYIVSNPPYGERLDDYVGLLPLYSQLGKHFKTAFVDWKLALLCSNQQLLKALKLRADKRYKLFNGKLETQLACYDLVGENTQQFDKAPSDNEFSNRLNKNLKRLKSWIKRTDSNAYRIYDADLPNYNFAIDCYADWVIVQEYAAPKNIPESTTQERLAQALLHLPIVLKCDKKKIVLKVREKKQGDKQYEKSHSINQRILVNEHGAEFLINPTDYLDVGLFLDHRLTRKRFAEDCIDKHVLNLFCYTGSVSVHAAKAGAKSIVSVDMSNTYIKWAQDNFKQNNLQGAYEFIQADCLKWIESTSLATNFDRIFIDPPSFSNSKRMEASWDVQRDHVALLQQAKEKLSKNGKIYFSNNLRNFKLEEDSLVDIGFTIENISQQTIDEDFKRSPKIHHCWILSVH